MKKQIKDFGINKTIKKNIYFKFGINSRKNIIKLKSTLLVKAESILKKKETKRGKTLRDNIKKNINFLIDLKNYKGNRHKLNYPVRGQRTHTNAKTRKNYKK